MYPNVRWTLDWTWISISEYLVDGILGDDKGADVYFCGQTTFLEQVCGLHLYRCGSLATPYRWYIYLTQNLLAVGNSKKMQQAVSLMKNAVL